MRLAVICRYALLDHVIDICTGDEVVCGLQCLGNEKGRSYNCFAAEIPNTEICHLNNETRFSRPEDLKKKQGTTYFEVMQVVITIFLKINQII